MSNLRTFPYVKIVTFFDWEERDDGSERAPVEYEVHIDPAAVTSTTIGDIVTQAGVPQRNAPHPENPAARCRRRRMQRKGDLHHVVIVTCDFDTKSETLEDDDDPLAHRTKGGIRGADKEKPAFFDAFGRPNVNTAGDLIPGLVRVENVLVFPCGRNFTTIPLWLFTLQNTLNDAALIIRGVSCPAGTCWLKNVESPDEPDTGNDGSQYWPVTWEIHHDPDGYYELHPNRGDNELRYQTRESSGDPWLDVSYATYQAKLPTTDRRVVKEPITSEQQQQLAGEMWLNPQGEAVRILNVETASVGTGAMTAESATLTITGATITAEQHTGAAISVAGAGPHGRRLVSIIEQVNASNQALLQDKAAETVSGADVYLPGALALKIVNQPLADWSSVPLPNNDPVN